MNNVFGTNIEGDVAPLVDTPPAPVQSDKPVGPRVVIVLEDNDNIPPTGQFIGHNGRGYMLRSGEEASVPPEIINILNDAVYDAPIVDSATKQILGYRKRLRFPYRVVRREV